MATATIDVVIKDVTLVLPLLADSTVASVSEAAVLEYRKFRLRDNPQKVLYTKDAKGRVLSGTLSLPLAGACSADPLSVVVQDYSQQDSAPPNDVLKLYRDWQLWGAAQIKENIQYLSFRESPLMPDATVFQLLEELSLSPGEDVQLSCLSSYRLLLSKFPQKSVVIAAAERISKMFAAATSPDVAIFALESFRDLSPLQMKLFDSSKYVRDMIDVQWHLTRFPADVRSRLFDAFDHVVAWIEDEELLTHLQRRKAIHETQTTGEGDQMAPGSSLEDGDGVETVADVAATSGDGRPTSSSSAQKKWNLSRLLSLLTSEDVQIKHYALEKIRKVLTTALAERRAQPPPPSSSSSTSTASREQPPPPVSTHWIVFKDEDEFQRLIVALFHCIKASIRGRQANSDVSPAAYRGLSTAGRLITVALTARDTDVPAVRLSLECLYLIYFHAASILAIGRPPVASSSPSQSSSPPRRRRHRLPRAQRHRSTDDKQINPLTGRRLCLLQRLATTFGREFHRLLFTLSHASEVLCFYRHEYGGRAASTAVKTIDPFVLEDIAEQAAFLFALVVLHHHPPPQYAHLGGGHGGGAGGHSGHSGGGGSASDGATGAYSTIRGWPCSALQPEDTSLRFFLALRRPCYRLYLALTFLLHVASRPQAALGSGSGSDAPPTRSRRVSSSRPASQLTTSRSTGAEEAGSPAARDGDAAAQTLTTRRSPRSDKAAAKTSTAAGAPYAHRLEELLCADQHRLLRLLWLWCIADGRRDGDDDADDALGGGGGGDDALRMPSATNFLVRRYAWRVLAEASVTVRVAEDLWRTHQLQPASLAAASSSSSSSAVSPLALRQLALRPTPASHATVELVPFLLTLVSRAYRYVAPSSASPTTVAGARRGRRSSAASAASALTTSKRSQPPPPPRRVTFVSVERANGVGAFGRSHGADDGGDGDGDGGDSDGDDRDADGDEDDEDDDEGRSDADDDGNGDGDDGSDDGSDEDDCMSMDSYSDPDGGDWDFDDDGDEADAAGGRGGADGRALVSRRPQPLALHRWSRAHARWGFRLRIDRHLLHALLKTLSNVLQVTPLAAVHFPPRHRRKLAHYLRTMRIGDDAAAHAKERDRLRAAAEVGSDEDPDEAAAALAARQRVERQWRREERRRVVSLDEIAARDRVVGVYYQLLLELLELPVDDDAVGRP